MTAELFDLTGRVAIVTGSSRGIGKAIALRMAQHGARVVVTSRKREACEDVAQEIRAAGGEATVIPCNIGHKPELQRLIDTTVATWGRLDILVCNAAINPYYGPAAEMPDEVLDKVLGYNIRSNFWVCNMAVPHLEAAGGGAIIIISSVAGLQGNDTLGAYALSKAAEMQLARNLALEWGGAAIRANCIAPGLIRTDFAKAIWDNPESYRRATQNAPLQRIGEPDEIAGAAIFLASAAGSFMTGQTMIIDGGRLAGGRVAA
jgi:NAD(P)-dependent dehydrogenase (short-subunit alcohol dehydrogenase family)